MPPKPSPADIELAIKQAENDEWIHDPDEEPGCVWECLLYDPDGELVGNGHAYNPNLAMAHAWLCVWAPAVCLGYVEPDSVPYDIPAGWRFELARNSKFQPS